MAPWSHRRDGWRALVALACFGLAAQPALGQHEPALVIAEGSVARQQVVALGRDLVVEGRALSDVAAVDGSIRVSGSVTGDVIVLGGDARLDSTARVESDVFVLGGAITAAQGARIGGRSVAHPTFSSAWLTLLEGPSLGGSALAPLVVGAKLALLAAWLLLAVVLLAVGGREVRRTSEEIGEEPLLCFMVGLTGVLAMFLTALFFSAFAAVLVGVPLLALVVVLALLLKLWGMVAALHALGSWLGARARRPRLPPLQAAAIGWLALGAVKLVPWVGTVVWTAATIVGIGAALRTKLGRREPWFQAEAPAVSRLG
jgi:hypothetical protein